MVDEVESGQASARPSPSDSETDLVYRELKTVFVGSFSGALALQAALAARGLETFILDEMVKTIDPFITGGNALDVRLQAPADREKDTVAVIRELHRDPGVLQEGAATAVEGGSAGEPEPVLTEKEDDIGQCPDPLLAEVEDLGARVRWASLVGVIGPLGIAYGLRYFLKAERLSRRPRQHGINVVAFFLCIVWTGVLLFFLTGLVALLMSS